MPLLYMELALATPHCFLLLFTGGLGAVAIVDGAIVSAAVDDDDDMILGCCFSAWNIL